MRKAQVQHHPDHAHVAPDDVGLIAALVEDVLD